VVHGILVAFENRNQRDEDAAEWKSVESFYFGTTIMLPANGNGDPATLPMLVGVIVYTYITCGYPASIYR
jgi:hypothetical protein